MNIPLIDGCDLERAEPGLYVMQVAPNVPQTQTFDRVYDVEKDEWVDGPITMVLMARVRNDDGRPLPKGVVDAWYRKKDGKQVIKAYHAPPQD